jgi:hypothetical protein
MSIDSGINQKLDLKTGEQHFREEIIDLQKLVLPPDFSKSLEVLRYRVPSEYYHQLWGEGNTNNDLALGKFFQQISSLLWNLRRYVQNHHKLEEYEHSLKYQSPDTNNPYLQAVFLQNQELSKIFDKVSLFGSEDLIAGTAERLKKIAFDDRDYERFFIMRINGLLRLCQWVLCENWKKLYYLNLKEKEREGSSNWVEPVFKEFSSPYVLSKNALYLREKILGQYEYKSGLSVNNAAILRHPFYFLGYEQDKHQDLLKLVQEMTQANGSKNGLALNRYASAYGEDNLKWTIQELRPHFERVDNLNMEQVGALQELADLLADYQLGSYPLLDLQVYSLVRDKIRKVFDIKFWV